MEELKKNAGVLNREIADATDRIKLTEQAGQLEELRTRMANPDFWQNPQTAQTLSKQEAALSRRVNPWLELQKEAAELSEMIGLSDEKMLPELQRQLEALNARLDELKKELRFQGAYDDHDVVLSIYAGAGGTDAQDWAQMLLRMYVRWAEGQKLDVRTVDESAGEEAGIKSTTIEISGGNFLYGKLAGEHGVHRLVRLSPFNADHLRQTSFAKVEVLPLMDRPEEVELDDKDLKIDVFRAGGHGGQSVNTTDSAVRITHLPTGISVSIQNERSQLQNKETAMSILRSKLVQLQLEQHAIDLADLKGPAQSAEWGSQIRSYVLHPYKQVKDLRTGYESSDVGKVLDGSLEPLIDSWVEHTSGA